MTFTKNKSTNESREFWEHVEAVAEDVRNQPQFHNHKTVGPLNSPAAAHETAPPPKGSEEDSQE